jgi:threonine/homoserine/homoserine lactone efflux protein
MLVLAVLPSVSVMTVVARSAAHGVRHGCLTAAGIVLGDLVLMLVALLGLAFVAETLGGFFTFLRYAGAAYLVWTGYRLWRQPPARGAHGRGDADLGVLEPADWSRDHARRPEGRSCSTWRSSRPSSISPG